MKRMETRWNDGMAKGYEMKVFPESCLFVVLLVLLFFFFLPQKASSSCSCLVFESVRKNAKFAPKMSSSSLSFVARKCQKLRLPSVLCFSFYACFPFPFCLLQKVLKFYLLFCPSIERREEMKHKRNMRVVYRREENKTAGQRDST